MAIYLENEDGSLTLIKADKSTADLIAEQEALNAKLGLESSPCVKDLLDLPAPTSTKQSKGV